MHAVVGRAIAKKPGERHQSAEELVAELDASRSARWLPRIRGPGRPRERARSGRGALRRRRGGGAPVIVRVLSRTPLEVLTAGGAEAALGVLAEPPVDVIVSDIDMPGINGLELSRRVRSERPDTSG